MKLYTTLILLMTLLLTAACTSCRSTKSGTETEPDTVALVGPAFSADSAYAFCEAQCAFGPRTMNSTAHDQCEAWIAERFRAYGLDVSLQRSTLTGWDGTQLRSCNIIARHNPTATRRILLCAHWDSRPWADNDPDSTNWHKPVLAANDGASGVAVMLEIARIIAADTTLQLGVDFVCFDAEDWGIPQWSDATDSGNTWALGAQYWATHPDGSARPECGILLDMVGGQGARFYQESGSRQYAPDLVSRLWRTASQIGYGSYFPTTEGGMVTDDHVPVNEQAQIPCIDIIPCYPDCAQSSFGPTWHTVSDDMDHIDRHTLKAVGQTVVQLLYTF